MTDLVWDTLIRNALVFDGRGEAPRQEDIALKNGQIAARGRALPESQAGRVQVVDPHGAVRGDCARTP